MLILRAALGVFALAILLFGWAVVIEQDRKTMLDPVVHKELQDQLAKDDDDPVVQRNMTEKEWAELEHEVSVSCGWQLHTRGLVSNYEAAQYDVTFLDDYSIINVKVKVGGRVVPIGCQYNVDQREFTVRGVQ